MASQNCVVDVTLHLSHPLLNLTYDQVAELFGLVKPPWWRIAQRVRYAIVSRWLKWNARIDPRPPSDGGGRIQTIEKGKTMKYTELIAERDQLAGRVADLESQLAAQADLHAAAAAAMDGQTRAAIETLQKVIATQAARIVELSAKCKEDVMVTGFVAVDAIVAGEPVEIDFQTGQIRKVRPA
jgi:hypothetical protein